jgi:hypothetical protein
LKHSEELVASYKNQVGDNNDKLNSELEQLKQKFENEKSRAATLTFQLSSQEEEN